MDQLQSSKHRNRSRSGCRIAFAAPLVCVLASLLLAAGFPVYSTAQVPHEFSSKPIFDEEFDKPALDFSKWSFRGLGKRDDCIVDPNAVSVANGIARISIYSLKTAGKLTNYCGAISTQSSFLHTYGYWQAAIRFKYQPGMQCSFWIQSPSIGLYIGNPALSGVEMDVFEHISGEARADGFDHAVHWDGYQPRLHKSVAKDSRYVSLDDGRFHVFGLAWTPQNLTFYIDGKKSWTLSGPDAAISQIAEYIILDTELPHADRVPAGGYGPLGAAQNAYFDVDYVRVYPLKTAIRASAR